MSYQNLSINRVETRIKPIVVEAFGGEDEWLPNLIADLKHWAKSNGLDWEQEEYHADRYVQADLEADSADTEE